MTGTAEKQGDTTYQFSVLNFQAQMRSGEKSEPIAVIVASEQGIFIVGSYPSSLEDLSDAGQAIINELPEVLLRQVEEAVGREEDLFQWLAAVNRWNLYLSPAQTMESPLGIRELAFDLYQGHVVQPGLTAEGFWGQVERQRAA